MSIFEQASREAFRFQSERGELTTEQLWDLPLQNKSGFDLDNVAKVVARDIKAMTEESFVGTPNKAVSRQQAKLEVVKHIIAFKIAEAEQAKAKVANAAMKAKLIGILEQKQGEALLGLSADELQKKIAELG